VAVRGVDRVIHTASVRFPYTSPPIYTDN
jgi:hypothetical protein